MQKLGSWNAQIRYVCLPCHWRQRLNGPFKCIDATSPFSRNTNYRFSGSRRPLDLNMTLNPRNRAEGRKLSSGFSPPLIERVMQTVGAFHPRKTHRHETHTLFITLDVEKQQQTNERRAKCHSFPQTIPLSSICQRSLFPTNLHHFFFALVQEERGKEKPY